VREGQIHSGDDAEGLKLPRRIGVDQAVPLLGESKLPGTKFGAILAPDLTLTPDRRTQMALQSGMYP
jgi:hypothetical protein